MITLLVLAATVSPQTAALTDPDAFLKIANDAFLAGDAAGAVVGYKRLLDADYDSADLEFNLGNAELNQGHRGLAVLAFERALRLDPSDADARANLQRAKIGSVDKIVGAESEPLWERAAERVPVDNAAALALGAWLAGFLLFFARRIFSKHAGRMALPMALLLVVACLSGLALAAAAYVQDGAGRSVVIAQAAKVHEGPSEEFKSTFEIHEGLTLRVVDHEGAFVHVRLPNGLEGWVDAAAVAKI